MNRVKRLYLLDELHGRWEYPELVFNARRMWKRHRATARPVKHFYIEKKASGQSLIQSLRRERVMAIPWLPRRYKFPEGKIDGFREASWVIAPDIDIGETVGPVWLPGDKIYPGIKTFIEQVGALSADDTHAHDDRADCLRIACSVFKRLGGGVKRHGQTAS